MSRTFTNFPSFFGANFYELISFFIRKLPQTILYIFPCSFQHYTVFVSTLSRFCLDFLLWFCAYQRAKKIFRDLSELERVPLSRYPIESISIQKGGGLPLYLCRYNSVNPCYYPVSRQDPPLCVYIVRNISCSPLGTLTNWPHLFTRGEYIKHFTTRTDLSPAVFLFFSGVVVVSNLKIVSALSRAFSVSKKKKPSHNPLLKATLF